MEDEQLALGTPETWPSAVVGAGCRQGTAWRGGATVSTGEKQILSGRGQKRGIQCNSGSWLSSRCSNSLLDYILELWLGVGEWPPPAEAALLERLKHRDPALSDKCQLGSHSCVWNCGLILLHGIRAEKPSEEAWLDFLSLLQFLLSQLLVWIWPAVQVLLRVKFMSNGFDTNTEALMGWIRLFEQKQFCTWLNFQLIQQGVNGIHLNWL